MDTQNAAVKPMINTISKGPLVMSKKKTPPINSINRAIKLEPIAINFFRPALLIKNTATIVNTT